MNTSFLLKPNVVERKTTIPIRIRYFLSIRPDVIVGAALPLLPKMQSWLRQAVPVAFCLILAGFPARAVAQSGLRQVSLPVTAEQPSASVLVRSVKVIPTHEGPAVEVIGTRPLTPIITPLEKPARLVVDLRGTYAALPKKIRLQDSRIRTVRMNQFQTEPPIARIVVDLLQPIGYSWDTAGNRLMIRLRPPGPDPTHPIETPRSLGPSMIPVSRPAGAIVLDEKRLAEGSSVSAGSETAILRLAQGGEIRVCPSTTVSLTYSHNRRDMLLGMSTGALEAHYSLPASADSVLTPDFRILLPGPGEFHYGISADSRGNTCIRALPGNTAAVVVSELMADGVYQVKPSEQVIFSSGHVKTISATPGDTCGCPPATLRIASSSEPLPPPLPHDARVEVGASFVLRADPDPPPSTLVDLSGLNLTYAQRPEPLEIEVLPPPLEPNGVVRTLKGFFSAIFR